MMTRTAPAFKESNVLGGNRQDECRSRGPTKRPAGPPVGGGGMGLYGPGEPEKLVGGIQAEGKWKGGGREVVDVMWAEGCYRWKGSALENKGLVSHV